MCSHYKQETPLEIVKEHLQTIQQGQLTEAYYAFSSSSFQEAISLEEFKHFLHNHPLILSAKTQQFEKLKPKKGIETIRVHFISEDGGKLTLEYQITKQRKAWKILAIYTSN